MTLDSIQVTTGTSSLNLKCLWSAFCVLGLALGSGCHRDRADVSLPLWGGHPSEECPLTQSRASQPQH